MYDAKDVLLLLLGLAEVVVGCYFGRVPAHARASQAQEQDNAQARETNDQIRCNVCRITQNGMPIGPVTSCSSPSLRSLVKKKALVW